MFSRNTTNSFIINL